MIRSLIAHFLWLTLALQPIQAQDSDEIQIELEKAKTAYSDGAAKAKTLLLTSIDDIIKTVAQKGDLDAVKALRAERQAFDESGKVPTSTRTETVAGEYRRTVQKNKMALDKAYDQAVRESTKALKIDQAELIRADWKTFQAGGGLAAPAAKTSTSTSTPKKEFPGTPRPAAVVTKEDLKKFLAGTQWEWGGDGDITLKADGYVDQPRWTTMGLVTQWEAIDRRTVLLTIEKGRNHNLLSVLSISENLDSYSARAFDRREIMDSKKRKK
ncbi:hypothetical protein [Zavarzinella formosa]|uniref:hypothetical protein n=1 Tax=Zavarzinella formosa TaxID=360055 RepID=UPI0002F96AC0|nr:hypothetical protein [Zavarzinella formosa]